MDGINFKLYKNTLQLLWTLPLMSWFGLSIKVGNQIYIIGLDLTMQRTLIVENNVPCVGSLIRQNTIFIESATGRIQSLSYDVHELCVCMTVCLCHRGKPAS